MTDTPIRVVVVDDHELVREGLRGVLDTDPALAVVGEASDGTQALAALDRHHPDVVVMDLQMPGMGGIEATRRVLSARPGTAVLVLTMYDDDDSVFAAVRAGARGYLLKGAARDELRAAVVAVALGQAVFGPDVASRVLDRMLHGSDQSPSSGSFPTLTAREREVLEGMVDGHQPPAIGRRLGVTEKTVRNNISSVLTKLQVLDRAAAVELARGVGIGGRPKPQRRVVTCTELDGSGVLARELGDAYAAVIREHNQVVDQAMVRRGGSSFGSMGSTRCAWFRDTDAAVAAAVDAQHDVANHRFPTGAAVSIRVGIHAGEVIEHAGELVGLALHEAARVASEGGEGQLLVSEDALPTETPIGWCLVDRGEHEIRDIDRPLRLFSVETVRSS